MKQLTLLNKGRAKPPVKIGMYWRRIPGALTPNCGQRYVLEMDGKDTGWRVIHCGHPTAHRPYYLENRTHTLVTGRAYAHVADAKAMAERLFEDSLCQQ